MRVDQSASVFTRRFLCSVFCGAAAAWIRDTAAAPGTTRIYRIAIACVSDDPATRLEGLGFSCADVRAGFVLAARNQPVELSFYDNRGERNVAISNIDEAIRKRVDLFIEYDPNPEVNAEAGSRLKAAAIPALAINYPIPGVPLYGADNAAAGAIAGEALIKFAAANWKGATVVSAIVGGTMPVELVETRVSGITAGLRRGRSRIAVTRIEGGSFERLEKSLTAFLVAQRGKKILVAALDDR